MLPFDRFLKLISIDDFKNYSKITNPKITILEILVYQIQPEIIKSKFFTRFNFITKPCSQEQNYKQNVPIKQVKVTVTGFEPSTS